MSLGLLFPGQGSQHPGMFESWLGRSALVEDAMREAIGGDPENLAPEEMRRNAVAQPLVVGHQMGSVAALRPVLPADVVVLGYSVGEISACGAAGMLALHDAVRLASKRATLMDRYAAPGSGMLAVRGLPLDRIRRLAQDHGVEIAIENGPDHAVLGGPDGSLDAAAMAATSAGAQTVRRLAVSISSHTGQLAGAAGPFRTLLERSLLRDPDVRFIAGVSAQPLYTRSEVIDSLARQLHTTLRFADAVTVAHECGVTAFLEIGPGQGLTQIVTDLLPDVPIRPLEAFRSVAGVKTWIDRHV